MAEHFLRGGNIRCALLSFDAWSNLVRPSELETMTDPEAVMELLRSYHMFGSLLRQVTRNALPTHNKAFNQLVGLDSVTVSSSAEDIAVLPRSFIYRWAMAHSSPPSQFRPGDPLHVGRAMAERWIRRALLLRLNTLLVWLHASAVKSGAFVLCEDYVQNGKCKPRTQGTPCNFHHPRLGSLSIIEFNKRLGIHLHIISALDHFTAVEGGYDEERNRDEMQGYVKHQILIYDLGS